MSGVDFSAVRDWTFGAALPFWAEHGSGGPAAFHEALTLDGAPVADAARRVRVIARQVYVFSHAAVLGWDGPALERARAGVEALERLAWRGGERGWARVLAPDGSVQDARADLYDSAFVLFALGWWVRASGEREALALAEATLDAIQRDMPHPSGRGYCHILPVDSAYQQNPHMHLAEACLAVHAAGGGDRWLTQAREIVQLFREHFYDPGSGAVTEFFDADWRPDPERGHIVEPGHQFEWAWILRRYMDASGEDLSAEIAGLAAGGERGVCAQSGLAYLAVSKDGGVLDARHRAWPQTERIKGNLALFETTGEDRGAQIAAALDALMGAYLAPAPRGAWIDVVDRDRRPAARDIPASTFYHVFLAFAELLRLQPALETR